MKKNFVKIKQKSRPSSMKSRSPLLKNTDKAKFPELAEKIIQMSDIILEVLDARFISETRNFEFEEKINQVGKKIIFVINKLDLIEIKKTKKEELSKLFPRVFVSSILRKGGKDLRDKIKIISKSIKKPVDKQFKKITVGVIGYPNTGKSSVINFLVGKPAAGTGSDAGFTKGIQKVGLTRNIVLIDSPGVIPRGEYSSFEISAMSKHAKVGARSYSQVKNPEIVLATLVKEFSSKFDNFYNLESNEDVEILIEKLGRKKGFLKKNNEVDEDKTARFILKNWQEGKIK